MGTSRRLSTSSRASTSRTPGDRGGGVGLQPDRHVPFHMERNDSRGQKHTTAEVPVPSSLSSSSSADESSTMSVSHFAQPVGLTPAEGMPPSSCDESTTRALEIGDNSPSKRREAEAGGSSSSGAAPDAGAVSGILPGFGRLGGGVVADMSCGRLGGDLATAFMSKDRRDELREDELVQRASSSKARDGSTRVGWTPSRSHVPPQRT